MAATINSAKIDGGKWKIMWLPKTASTLISANVLVELVSGQLTEATTTAGGVDTPLMGINLGGTQAAADATTALIPVAVPQEPSATMQLLIDTGTMTAAMVGLSFDISATGGVTQSTSTNEPVTLVKFLSTTQGIFCMQPFTAPNT